MKDHGPRREALISLANVLLAGWVFGVLLACAWFGTASHQLPTQQRHYAHEDVAQMEHLTASGQSLYEKASAVSFILRESISELAGSVAARPAYAHATALCTTSSGKVTNKTTYSRHLTSWRYDGGGYRYTTTRHQVLEYYGWTTTAKYAGKIALRNC